MTLRLKMNLLLAHILHHTQLCAIFSYLSKFLIAKCMELNFIKLIYQLHLITMNGLPLFYHSMVCLFNLINLI